MVNGWCSENEGCFDGNETTWKNKIGIRNETLSKLDMHILLAIMFYLVIVFHVCLIV